MARITKTGKLFNTLIILTLVLFISVLNCYPQTSWDGGGGNNLWSEANNWNPNAVPTITDDVVIGSGFSIRIDADATCASLTISANSTNDSIFLDTGISLSVSGDINFNSPTVDGVNQTINVADGNLICQSLYLANTANDDQDNYLYLNNGNITVNGTLTQYGSENENRVEVFGNGTINIGEAFSGGSFYRGNSTVNYSGTADQLIWDYYYHNLGVSNGGVKTLRNNTLVYNNIILDNVINLNTYQLRVYYGSVLTSGTFGSTTMLDFQDGGTLRIDGDNSGYYEIVYPLGTSGIYTPFEISSLTATIGGGYIIIRLSDTKHPFTSGNDNVTTRYWDIQTANISNITDIQSSFLYDDSDVATPITEANLTMVGRLDGIGWQTNETGTSYEHSTNKIVLNGAVPDLDGSWTLGEPTGCFDGTLPGKYTVANGNWNTGSTWSDGTVPDPSDNVAILHTVTLDVDATVNSLEAKEVGKLDLSNNNLIVTTTTNIGGSVYDSGNNGEYTFNGKFTVEPGGYFSVVGADPYRFGGGITNNGTFEITSTASVIEFNSNSQIIDGTNSITLAGATTIASGITVANNISESSTGLSISGVLDGTDGTSVFQNNAVLTYLNETMPMATGSLDVSSNPNTVNYSLNGGTQYINPATYDTLILSTAGNKRLTDSTTVTGHFATSGTTYNDCRGYSLTLNGTVDYQSSNSFVTGTNIVTYGRNGDQNIITASYSGELNTTGTGNKTIQGDISVTGNMFIAGTSSLNLNSNDLTTSGNIAIANGATLFINDNAQLAIANTRTLTNEGTLRVVGTSGNIATITRNGGTGGYSVIQNHAGAEFHALYYLVEYTDGGITISNGTIDNTNNFSEGTFTSGSGTYYMDLTGLDATGLSNIVNAVFESGPTYNINRTSGTGSVTIEDASGTLAGENNDNDNGNPGTLINWEYPSSTYYSRGNLSAGLTSSWSSNSDGTGANPASVMDGTAILIVQDGHTITVDNNGDIDVLELHVGEGTSGTFRIGSGATQQSVTIQELMKVNTGATVNAGSSGSPAHRILLYGNIENDGTINLKTTATNFVNTEVYGNLVFLGSNSPVFNDITFKSGCVATALAGLDINGNVFIEDNAEFDDGGASHNVEGNWSVTGTGLYTATGTIIFDGLVNTISDNPSAGSVTFHNITFAGVAGSIQENTIVNGEFLATNSSAVSAANIRVTLNNDFTIDANASYTQNTNATAFEGNSIQSLYLNGSNSFYNLYFLNGGTDAKTVNGDATTTGRMIIYEGATVSGSDNFEIANGLQVNGTCNLSGEITLTGSSLFTSNTSNTLLLGTAKLIIDGAVYITHSGPATSCTANVNNDVEIIGGYLVINTDEQLIGQSGNMFKLEAGCSLYVRGVDNFPTGFGTYELDPDSWVRYDRPFDQVIRGNITYGHLYTAGTSTTKTVDGPLDINGNLDLNSETILDLQTYLHTLGRYLYNNTNSSIEGSLATFTLDGDDINQIVQSSGTGAYNLGNLHITQSGATANRTKTFYDGSTINISGNFNLSNIGGSESIKLIVDLNDNAIGGSPVDITVGEYCQINTDNKNFGTAVTDNFTGTKSFNVSSTVYYTLADTQIIADGFTYGNLTFTSGNKIARGDLDIDGDIYRAGGTPVFYDGGYTHTIAGDWLLNSTNYYTQSSATGTIVFDGADQDINGYNFNNLVFANSGVANVVNNLQVFGDLTVNAGASIDFSTRSLSLGGDLEVLGDGLFTQTTGTSTFNGTTNQTISSNASSYLGNFTINKPNAAGLQQVTLLSELHVYGNTYISTDAGLLDISGQDMYIGGNFYVYTNTVETGSTFISTGSNVYFYGSDAQYIRNYRVLPMEFNNVVFTGAGDKTIDIEYGGSRNFEVDGNFTISGSTVQAGGWGRGGMDIYVRGDWNNTGTFLHNNNRTVYFDGANQSITSSGFWNVNFGGTDEKSLQGNISVYSNLTIAAATLNANGHDISIDGNWDNSADTAAFMPGTGNVTFNGGTAYIYTGASSGSTPGKSFYDLEINKNSARAWLRGHLDVDNDFVLTSGYFRTDTNSMYLAGNFDNAGGIFEHNNDTSIITLDATGGTKQFNPDNIIFRGIVVDAPGTKYALGSDFTFRYVDFNLLAGEFVLNGNQLQVSSTGRKINIDGGTLNIDSASTLLFTANSQSIELTSGELHLVGTPNYPAKVERTSGQFSINQTGGLLHAQYYQVNNGNFFISGGSIDATDNLSNGSYMGGSGNAYITLNGLNFADFSANNLIFNTGPTYNIARTSGTGVITVMDATGGLAGEYYDQDNGNPGTLIEWVFPTGFFWDGGASTDNWHDANNWSGNTVPGESDIAYLNHDYVAADYIIRITSDSATAQRVVIDAQGGNTIGLSLENGYDLNVDEHLQIGTNTTVSVSDNTSNIYIGKNFTNQGTFNHGNSTIYFDGSDGNYLVSTGGSGTGKSLYNLYINADNATYNLGSVTDVDNDVIINKGTLNASSGTNDLTVAGDWLVNQLNGGIFEYSTADVILDGTDQFVTNGEFYNLITSGTGTKTLQSNIDVNNDLTINTGTTLDGQENTLYVGDDWYNNGDFTQTGLGTVIFNGTGGQYVDAGANVTTFNNLEFINSGWKRFYNASNVTGNIIINGATGSVILDTFQITGIGSSNSLSSFGTLDIRGINNFPQGFEDISFASNSSVYYTADSIQYIYPTEYGHLRLRSLAPDPAYKIADSSLVVTGNLYLTNDTLTKFDLATNDASITLTGTISILPENNIYWGTGNSTLEHVGGYFYIDEDIDTLNNIILGGTGAKYTRGNLIVTGDLTVKSNIDLRMYDPSDIYLYHTIEGLPTKTFTLENGARVLNTTPATAATAFPTNFGTYTIDKNSTVYLYSPDTVDQLLYTGSSIQYGNLYFYNEKDVTSDGIADLDVNGTLDFNDASYFDGGRNIKVAGNYAYLTYYTPSSNTISVTLDGLTNQYLRDDRENNIVLGKLVCSGAGTKTIGDGNDALTIDGDFIIDNGVTAATSRDITFNGTNWLNSGIFTHTANRTVRFTGTNNQTIDPGASDPSNYFRNVVFYNNSKKTFINNGADINGNFVIYTDTVDLGNQTHNIYGRLKNITGGTLISGNANIIFDGGSQNIITPDFTANDITISGSGTKRLFSDWTINGDLLINAGTYLNTADSVSPANYYDINIKGDWTNNGTFVDNTSTVTFDGANSPISITSGGSNFYDIAFSPSSTVAYDLQSSNTRIARSLTVDAGATLNLNSQTLALGSYISSGKIHTINGVLSINENATLQVNNQSSQSILNVGGTLRIVGTDNSNIATLTRENSGSAGNETQINVLSGGTLEARYYLIEHLQDEGMNLEPGSILHPTNNLSDGTWSNIRNASNVRYLSLESDYSGDTIRNITFNFTGTPTQGTHFNVVRETATPDIIFDAVGGNLGSYKYEDDEEATASATTGKLQWPAVTETNWIGAINNDWHVDGNWDNGVPTLTLDAIIPDRPNDPVVSNGNAECKNLTITTGTLILDNNRDIVATGDISIGEGTNVGILSVNTPNSTIYAGGLWTKRTNGVFIHGNGTVIFNSGAGSTTIEPGDSNFYNVVFNNALTNFYLSGATINIKGKIEVLNGIVAPSTDDYTYNISGDFTVTDGTFMPIQGGVTDGVIVLDGTDQQITDGVFYDIEIAGSGVKTFNGTITIDGNTTVYSTMAAASGSQINFEGNVEIDSMATFNDGDQTHTFSGQNWYGTGSYQGNGTIVFDRTSGDQNLYASTFNNLDINCQSRRLLLRDSVALTGDLTIRQGINYVTLYDNVFTNSTGIATFTMEETTRVYVYGEDNFPKNFGFYDINASSTVYYYGASDQEVEGVSYGNLYFDYANTKTLKGDVDVKGNLYFRSSTIEVTNNNYTLSVAGVWNNNSTGNFICRQGEVIFNGSENQYIAFGATNTNDFYNLTVTKNAGYAYAANNTTNDFRVLNDLTVTSGQFSASGRTVYISNNMIANGSGTFRDNTGTYYLNKASGTAQIRTNGSSLLNLTINSSGGATYTALDDITLVGDFNLISGSFNGNGKYISLGNGNSDIVNISGTYTVGAGGSLALGSGTTLTVDNSGTINIIGSESAIARVTRNASGGRYNFIVNGTIAAKYYLFEYMSNAGIYLSSTSVIDPSDHFSFGTFTRGANSGQLLRIENNQVFVDPDYIESVSFPINPGGSASNVAKTVSTTGMLEFYDASGAFAGEDYDNDPSDSIIWTGPIELTWNGSVSTDWFDSLNWTASYGSPIVPTENENVFIAPATNQPILTTYGAKTANLEIQSGASITITSPVDNDSVDLDVNGDLTIVGSLKLLGTGDFINIEGSWTKNNAGSVILKGNVTFDGVGGAKVINNRNLPFYNVTISGASQYQIGDNTFINNNLHIEPGATFDVTSSNYSLTVKGDWQNEGTFLSHNGKVTFSSTTDPRTIQSGGSSFNDIDINSSGVTYQMTDDLTVKRNVNIINGVLDINNNTLTVGDGSGTDNLTVTGTLLAEDNAIIEMGNSARLNVNSGGTFRFVGTDDANRVKITGLNNGRYSIDINSGSNFDARYYEIEYIDEEGLYVHSGAGVDSVNNLSEGIFSNGYPGIGVYINLHHEQGYNDTIRNVVFNSGAAFNVSRTSGTATYYFLDASGALGSYEYENDDGIPDPGSGYLQWPFKNTYIWTGASDSNWHNTANWSSLELPDTSKNVIIFSSATHFPVISFASAEAKTLTVGADAELTISNDLSLIGDVIYEGSITVSGSPVVTVAQNWTESGGTFTPDSSTVRFVATSGTNDIDIANSSFYNVVFDAAGAEYQTLNDMVVLNDFSITNGTFNLNGNDMTVGGGLSNSGTFTVGNQKVTFNGDNGDHNIESGSASFYNIEINSSTGNASYLLAENLNVANNFTVVRGGFSLSPDGGTNNYDLSVGNRFTNIMGSFVAHNGDITVAENWVSGGAASFDPGTGLVTFTSNSGTRTIDPKSNAFYNVTFNGSATFRLSGNLDVNNDLNISNGTLDVGIAPSYTVHVGGNWTNNANFEERAGKVIFDGADQQLISATDEVFYNLTVDDNSLTLDKNVNVVNIFQLDTGLIDVQSNTLTLGTGTSNIGSLSYTNGAINGKFERWMNAIETDYIYPLGTSTSTNTLIMRFITNITPGSAVAEFIASNPGISGMPISDGGITIDSVFTDGYWGITSKNGLASTDYNVTLDASGFSSYLVMGSTRLIKRTNGGAWGVDGNHIPASGNNVFRQGMSGIAVSSTEFGLGKIACIGGEIGVNAAVCPGDDLAPFTNVSLPTGAESYTYTWQYTEVLGAVPGDSNWTDVPSSNSAAYDYGTLTNTTKFVRKENGVGCSVKYSNVVTITVDPKANTGKMYRKPNN